MNRASTEMREFARRLIEYQALEHKSPSAHEAVTFQVFDKLRPSFSKLMGTGGFRALLGRALTLAAAEVSWLKAMHVKVEGDLGGLEDIAVGLDADDLFEGEVVLLAQLLGLMVAFIGEVLTLRMVREVWPMIPLNDLNFGNGGKQ